VAVLFAFLALKRHTNSFVAIENVCFHMILHYIWFCICILQW